jgi:hypothetical protein
LEYSDKVDVFWDLRKEHPKIWQKLQKTEESLTVFAEKLFQDDVVPIHDCLDDFCSERVVRPEGSRRAFYIKFDSGAVLAIKGTEVLSSLLKLSFENDSKNKLPNRPWTLFENFIFREQKAPLALLFHEAFDETVAGAAYQQSVLDAFGQLEEAPIPLIVHKWEDSVKERYLSELEPFLNERSKNLIYPLINEYSLGTSIYYYPYLPTRIRYTLPMTSGSLKERNQQVFGDPNITGLPSVNRLIKIVARMLSINYLPLSFHDHGIGQCIAPQNVTLNGGICDMGSLFAFSKIRSDKEFYELTLSMGVMLSKTSQALLLDPLPNLIYEFEDPTTSSVLLNSYIWSKLSVEYDKACSIAGLKTDPRLDRLLSFRGDDALENILHEVFE